MANIHELGTKLQNYVRATAASHIGRLARPGHGVSGEIAVSSPPMGHELRLETEALILAEHERVIFLELELLTNPNKYDATKTQTTTWTDPRSGNSLNVVVDMGFPRRGDVWIDTASDQRWRVLPNAAQESWTWHDQTQTSVEIMLKRDNETQLQANGDFTS